MKLTIVAAVLVAVALLASWVVYGVLVVVVRIPAYGNVYGLNLKVFSDQACTQDLTSINWTTLSPGQSRTVTCWLKSISTMNASLTIVPSNWFPVQAANYISLSWDREGYSIVPGEVVAAALTLQVNGAIWNVSSFSFDTVVTAVGA